MDGLLLVIAAGFAAYFIRSLRLSRDFISASIRAFVLGAAIGVMYFATRGQLMGDTLVTDSTFFGLGALVFVRQKRSRCAPAKLRTEVIAFDFKTQRARPLS